MKSRIHIILLALLSLLTILPSAPAEAADMTDYCIVPPYVMRDIQPNVMIVLDNAEINGEAAYMSLRPDDAGYFMPTNPKLAAGSIFTYNPAQNYEGIFVPNVWYYYAGGDFVPQVPDNSVKGKQSVFEGNLLNWATTSRYDLIMKILVGGKSASRQPANYNTLIGINSGVWEQRIYHYVGEDGARYTCTFTTNVGDKGDLTISESSIYYQSGDLYQSTCGLILTTPVRPVWKDGLGVRYRYNETSTGSIMGQYADAREDAPAGVLRVAYRALNAVMGAFASEAEAAQPLTIFSPKTNWIILTDSELGVSYSYTPLGTGGTGNYVWSAVPDARPWKGLPAGLTVDPVTGAISGIPTGPANDATNPYYAFALKLHDTGLAAPDTPVYRFLNIKVTGKPLTISVPTTQLDDGQQFTKYNKGKGFYCQAVDGNPFISGDLASTGVDVGLKYYHWAASGLPAGLTIHANTGLISGYISADAGTYSVTLTATDSAGTVATANVTMKIHTLKVSILTPPNGGKLPSAVRFSAYSGAQAIAGGGTSPYTWSMTGPVSGVNTFPNISISAVTGAISVTGVVTAKPGDYTTTITVTDSKGATATSTVTITVEGNALTVTKPDQDYVDLPSAELLKAYVGYTPQAAYGSGMYTWTVTGLPAGMGYIAATGKIGGTPAAVQTTAGSIKYTLTFKVTDSVSSETATRYAYLTVNNPVRITWPTNNFGLGDSIHGVDYPNRFQAVAQGGFGPLTWSATNLPVGFSINPATGLISGKPVGVIGYYTAIISVTDGFTSDKVSIGLYDWGSPSTIMIISAWDGGSMPAGTVGSSYGGYSIGTYYGYGQNVWTITGLPLGLSYDVGTGLVSGTPTVAGTYVVNYTVVSGATVDTVWLNLTINNPTVAVPSIQYPYAWNGFPEGTQYKLYTPVQAEATGGTPPYTWSSLSGVPTGMAFSAAGVLSGTPTVSGWYWLSIQVKDSAGQIDIQSVWLDIHSNAVKIQSPVALEDMPTAYYNYDYMGADSFKLAAIHGSGTYTWAVTGLPAGMTFDSGTLTIDGIPTSTATANYSVTVSVKDAVYGYTDTVVVTLPLVGTNGITYVSPTGAAVLGIPYPPEYDAVTGAGTYENEVGKYWAMSPVVVGGTPPYTWAVTGLAPGLTRTSGGVEAGHVRGYPLDTFGTIYDMYFKVTDANGLFLTRKIRLNLVPVVLLKATFNIRVCAGDYVDNCNTTPPAKSGLLNEKWSEARWGFTDFDNTGAPTVGCLPETNEPSFFTAVENAVPVGVFTELVNSIYKSIERYQGIGTPTCDPFDGDTSPCRRNFILMLTDGSGADNPPVPSGTVPSVFGAADTPPMPAACAALPYALAKNACYGYINDLRSDLEGNQSVSTYIVSAMGTNDAILQMAADESDGLFYKANDPSELARQIAQALEDIIKRAASGTAASVLASGKGTGANLIQALYFPRREFVDVSTGTKDQISWIGMISDFWYYVDPRFRYNSIREETVQSVPPVLNLIDDYSIGMFFNTTSERVEATRYKDPNADGNADVYVDTVDFSEVTNIWEVGQNLWERDLTTNPRTIYTSVDGQNLIAFTNATAAGNATLRQYLNATDAAHAEEIARWIHGEDIAGYRSRTVSADASGVKRVWKLGDILNSTPKIVSSAPMNPSYDRCIGGDSRKQYHSFLSSASYTRRGVVYAGGNDGMLHAFYLGIMNVGEWTGRGPAERARLENDLPGVELGDELWSYIPKNALPYLQYQMEGDYCHVYTVDMTPYVVDAMVVADTTSPQALALLPLDPIIPHVGQSASCTQANYEQCRATMNSWRTILIGGMRYGGACEPVTTVNCPVDLNGDGDFTNDCVKAPIAGVGFSSYFALDITDTTAPPTLLWEFTHADLGYSTTGPSIVHLSPEQSEGYTPIEAQQAKDNFNGKWFVVFGSGPTGPIKKSTKQFMAQSDQNLRFFAFDLYQGPGTNNADVSVIDSGIARAFAGSMIETTVDSNLVTPIICDQVPGDPFPGDFEDDALYVGYVTPEANDSEGNLDGPAVMWNNGGIGRLVFNSDLNPANWVFSPVIENIGPVTAAPTHLAHKINPKALWVFGASGRYYFLDTDDPDDALTPGVVVGFPDPCFLSSGPGVVPFVSGCTATATLAGLDDVSLSPLGSGSDSGWYLTLDGKMDYTNPDTSKTITFYAERVITDLYANAREGLVYVTSMRPYADICSIGGVSSVWVFRASSGGAPTDLLKGTAIVQVSTGSIEQIDLATAFDSTNETTRGGRRTSFFIKGLPPMMQGMSMFEPPKPQPRVMHIIQKTQERLP